MVSVYIRYLCLGTCLSITVSLVVPVVVPGLVRLVVGRKRGTMAITRYAFCAVEQYAAVDGLAVSFCQFAAFSL